MTRLQALLCVSLLSSSALAAKLCTASQKCWPSPETWSAFNSSIGGRLVAPRPPAWPCHDPNYDEAACNEAKTNWESSFWRSNQTGAMENPVWESLGCDIDTPRNVPCDQGFVPVYSVVAVDGNDVSAAVKFAGKHRLKLVVKNTGHDYLGRSSAKGSFSIWTHNIRGINFSDAFVPTGCSNNTGEPAVTVRAAEQWRSVYQAADARGVIVVGGAANSVGAAGGWIQGGGHSPLGALYGMGVDNVLQYNIVKPDGKVVAANACQNKDLFWALLGGGGGTWGVTLDVTYKTHAPLQNVVAVLAQVNATGLEQLIDATSTILHTIPSMTDKGVRGYGFWLLPINSFAFVLIHPNSPSIEFTNSTLGPIYDWVAKNSGATMGAIGTVHPTFFDFFSNYITDIGIAVPSWLGGRLISSKALLTNSTEMSKLISGGGILSSTINIVGGGAVNTFDPDSTSLNPQWRKDALISWNFSGHIPENGTSKEIDYVKRTVTKYDLDLGELSGLEHAAYWNEADPGEPMWKKSFFGSHYKRLLKIKKKVDPKGLFTCNRCVGSDL
ncbi:putative FAD binding domain protein [Ceratobasidium sp. AG-I]|nr:putative FAD binding domain protein [Ceratobasidium sp. AG-I]